jgi:hypothetical protein
MDDKWQVDLIDYKKMDPLKNQGFRVVLVVVFSRFTWAVPMKAKTLANVIEAFTGILSTSGRKPAEVHSDAGGEFNVPFSKFLEEQGIAHRLKNTNQINALAAVDATISKIKKTIAQDMAEDGSGNWVKFLERAVRAANNNSHSSLLGSRPTDVKGNTVLQYTLEAEAGRFAKQNVMVYNQRVAKLRAAGTFRVLLPRQAWVRVNTPKWSNEVHRVKSSQIPTS